MLRTKLTGVLVHALAATTIAGCQSRAESSESGQAEVNAARGQLETELRLLAGSEADLGVLIGMLDQRLNALQQAKDAAKVQAQRDVASYTPRQWDRSWFRQDELETAV